MRTSGPRIALVFAALVGCERREPAQTVPTPLVSVAPRDAAQAIAQAVPVPAPTRVSVRRLHTPAQEPQAPPAPPPPTPPFSAELRAAILSASTVCASEVSESHGGTRSTRYGLVRAGRRAGGQYTHEEHTFGSAGPVTTVEHADLRVSDFAALLTGLADAPNAPSPSGERWEGGREGGRHLIIDLLDTTLGTIRLTGSETPDGSPWEVRVAGSTSVLSSTVPWSMMERLRVAGGRAVAGPSTREIDACSTRNTAWRFHVGRR